MRDYHLELGLAGKNMMQIADLEGRAVQRDQNGGRKSARKRVQQRRNCFHAASRCADRDDIKRMISGSQ
jgi:hypothetical protein